MDGQEYATEVFQMHFPRRCDEGKTYSYGTKWRSFYDAAPIVGRRTTLYLPPLQKR